MPRNGHSNGHATAAVAEPDELYDSLSQDGQDEWDAIGTFGFKPEKGAAGLWFARKPGQEAKDAIGPADSLQVLHEMVKANAPSNPDEVEIMETAKGPRLPSIPLVADQQILDAAGKAKAINEEWKQKGKERKEAYDNLKAICHAKSQLFTRDPNNSNAKIYQAGGILIRLKDVHKKQVEVELLEDDDD